MRFKFCGDADCPDWVLAEINNLSKLSSVKLKLLTQVVAKGIINQPIDMTKAEKLFTDSKLDNVDLKACIACITFIINSTIKFNCDHNAMNSELQQLGLPREHSTSIKKVITEQESEIKAQLKAASLRINRLEDVSVTHDKETNCTNMKLTINGDSKSVLLTTHTVDVLLEELKSAKQVMTELNNASYVFH